MAAALCHRATAAAPIQLADAGERGTFNVGTARATLAAAADGAGLRLDVAVPPSGAAGVWLKGFPAELDTGVQLLRARARSPEPDKLSAARLALELKGQGDAKQRIAVPIGGDWTTRTAEPFR